MSYLTLLVVALLADHPSGVPNSALTTQTRTSPGDCEDPVDQRPAGGKCVATVHGKAVDETGTPLPDLVVSVCAAACYYGKTGDDGAFAVRVYSHLVIDQYATLVHGRPDHANYYTPLPRAAGSTYRYAAPLQVPRMPEHGSAIATNGAAQTLTAGDVTLHLTAGTKVEIPIEDRMLGDIGSQLRVTRIANPRRLPFVDAAAPPSVLYGFAPFEVRFSRKTRVSFANTSRLPAGSAVDVQGMRGLLADTPPAGRFTSVATAHVSADGSRIEMDPGEGVLSLTWLALRPR
jgi:hypothetical protein